MPLEKTIPSRKVRFTALWVRMDFLAMGDEYRAARARMRKKLDSCWWCRHKFDDGEMMALACIEGKGNVVLCRSCANMVKDDARKEG